MTTSIRSAANDGALQINGVDAVPFNSGGVRVLSLTPHLQNFALIPAPDGLQ